MEMSGFAPQTLYPRRKKPTTRWKGDWVGHRACLSEEKTLPCRESSTGRPTLRWGKPTITELVIVTYTVIVYLTTKPKTCWDSNQATPKCKASTLPLSHTRQNLSFYGDWYAGLFNCALRLHGKSLEKLRCKLYPLGTTFQIKTKIQLCIIWWLFMLAVLRTEVSVKIKGTHFVQQFHLCVAVRSVPFVRWTRTFICGTQSRVRQCRYVLNIHHHKRYWDEWAPFLCLPLSQSCFWSGTIRQHCRV
jgi:hypothetical protein